MNMTENEKKIYLRNEYILNNTALNKSITLNNIQYFNDYVNKNAYVLKCLNIEMFKQNYINNVFFSNVAEVKTHRDKIKCYYFIDKDGLNSDLNNSYVIAYKIIPHKQVIYKKGNHEQLLVAYDITHTTKTKYKIDKNDVINYYHIEYHYNDGVFMKIF